MANTRSPIDRVADDVLDACACVYEDNVEKAAYYIAEALMYLKEHGRMDLALEHIRRFNADMEEIQHAQWRRAA